MVRPTRGARLLLLCQAVLLSGCASGARYANEPRPAQLSIISTAITVAGVDISPSRLDAGVVSLVITNLTHRSQQLYLQADGAGAFRQQTAPINPSDTAELKALLPAGSYTVGVGDRAVRPARLAVGAPRPADRGQLLLP